MNPRTPSKLIIKQSKLISYTINTLKMKYISPDSRKTIYNNFVIGSDSLSSFFFGVPFAFYFVPIISPQQITIIKRGSVGTKGLQTIAKWLLEGSKAALASKSLSDRTAV